MGGILFVRLQLVLAPLGGAVSGLGLVGGVLFGRLQLVLAHLVDHAEQGVARAEHARPPCLYTHKHTHTHTHTRVLFYVHACAVAQKRPTESDGTRQ